MGLANRFYGSANVIANVNFNCGKCYCYLLQILLLIVANFIIVIAVMKCSTLSCRKDVKSSLTYSWKNSMRLFCKFEIPVTKLHNVARNEICYAS